MSSSELEIVEHYNEKFINKSIDIFRGMKYFLTAYIARVFI